MNNILIFKNITDADIVYSLKVEDRTFQAFKGSKNILLYIDNRVSEIDCKIINNLKLFKKVVNDYESR